MSIKVYQAWQVPLKNLNEATDVLHKLLLEEKYIDDKEYKEWTK